MHEVVTINVTLVRAAAVSLALVEIAAMPGRSFRCRDESRRSELVTSSPRDSFWRQVVTPEAGSHGGGG